MPILFRMKPGMGSHYIRRHGAWLCLNPGDRIRCEPHELGGAIWKFDQLEPDPPSPQPKVGLKAVHRGGGWWDVINETTGKAINDQRLKKEEAQKLASSPSKEQTETVEGE